MALVPVDAGLRRKSKQCNCKNSRCLKLYCECFASGQYCEPGGCNCVSCFNNRDCEQLRAEAIEATLERNPSAFRPKIAAAPVTNGVAVRHHKGCNCKKSGCLKKYCECYQGGIMCSDACKCVDCRNYENSPELHAALTAASKGYSMPLPPPKKRVKAEVLAVPSPSGRGPSLRGASGLVTRSSGAALEPAPAPSPSTRGAADRRPPVSSTPVHGFIPTPTGARGATRAQPYTPEPAVVRDFAAVTEETLRDECAKFMVALAPLPDVGSPLPMSPDGERTILATLLGSLRSFAGRVAGRQ